MLHTTLTVEIELDSRSAALELEDLTAPPVTDPSVWRSEHHDQGRLGW